jgi:hypothetical protein
MKFRIAQHFLSLSSFLLSLIRFGGILGDDPPRDRTGILRKDGYPSRHLGPVQMTTDTALGVTKLCVQDGSKFSTFGTRTHTIRLLLIHCYSHRNSRNDSIRRSSND